MIQFKENIDEEKARTILIKEQMINEEKKLYPVLNVQSSLLTNPKTVRNSLSNIDECAIQVENSSEAKVDNKNPVPISAAANNVKTVKLVKKSRHKPNMIDPSKDELEKKNKKAP